MSCGFPRSERSPHNTLHAMMVLLENIYKAWKDGNVFTAIFLDVAGAFNNVHHRCLLHNLQHKRLPTCIVKWLETFLTARKTALYFNGMQSMLIEILASIPQGSPLSPLLYMYYNADLLDSTNGTNKQCMSLGFIDDIVYGKASPSAKENVENLKYQLQRTEKWRRKHGA